MARFSIQRRARSSLVIATALTFGAVGCNAILGIDAGHLVPAGADAGNVGNGTGGSSSVDSGAGGSGASPQDSGADVSASGGKGGASGSGGKGGTAGKGGLSGAGGSAGTPDGGGDAGPITGPFGVPGEVQCDTASCKLPGQACCVAISDGASHCSASCDSSTQVRFACDGAEDCTSGQHCCYPIGATTASCAATCTTGKVFCGSARDCLPGQACELGGGALAKVYVCTDVPTAKTVWCGGAPCDLTGGKSCCYDKAKKTETCTATACTGSNAVSFTCDAADDCGTGATCCESHTGFGVATGTSCTAATSCASGHAPVECGGEADCGAGLHCCLSGSGSTCLATCTGATVCDTDADCPVGQTCSVETSTALGAPTGRTRCATP